MANFHYGNFKPASKGDNRTETMIYSKGFEYWECTSCGNTLKTVYKHSEVKAGDIHKMVKAKYPNAKVGFKASDFGSAVAAQCQAEGYGNTLWMK